MKWYNQSIYIDIKTNKEIEKDELIKYTIIKTTKKVEIDTIPQIGRITFINHCIKLQLTLDIL